MEQNRPERILPKRNQRQLKYYATQFNSIELNATFYSLPESRTNSAHMERKTPPNFKFFQNHNTVSHFRRLINVTDVVTDYATSVLNFGDQLGMVFLQLHDNFKPKDFDRVEKICKRLVKEVPLAIEVRSAEWFEEKILKNSLNC